MTFIFIVANFFLLHTDGSNWYFSLPIYTVDMVYILVLNFEVRLLSDVADFASVYPLYQGQFHLSKQTSPGYTVNLYSSFYYRMRNAEKQAGLGRQSRELQDNG